MAKRRKKKAAKPDWGELQRTRTTFVSQGFHTDGRFATPPCTYTIKRLYKKDKVLIITQQKEGGVEKEVWRKDYSKP